MFVNTFLTTNLAESGPLTWEMAKQIIQAQSNLATVAISALVGIAAFLLIGSWIRNNRVQKQELKKITDLLRSEVLGEMKRDFVHLTKEIKDETNKTIQDTKENISRQLTLLETEKARLFALVNQQNKEWAEAISWWAEAIIKSAECKNDFLLRNGVDGLSFTLEEYEKKEIPLPEKQRKGIKRCLSYIPKLLIDEKEEIEDKLKKLSG